MVHIIIHNRNNKSTSQCVHDPEVWAPHELICGCSLMQVVQRFLVLTFSLHQLATNRKKKDNFQYSVVDNEKICSRKVKAVKSKFSLW